MGVVRGDFLKGDLGGRGGDRGEEIGVEGVAGVEEIGVLVLEGRIVSSRRNSSVSMLGMLSALMSPIATNFLTLLLFTLSARPFLKISIVPLEKVFITTNGPSHLSSIFSLVFRNNRLSKNTNCPGWRFSCVVFASCLSLYCCVFLSDVLFAICRERNMCLSKLSMFWLLLCGIDMFVEYAGW